MNLIFDKLPKELQKKTVNEIITRIGEIEDTSETGMIAAQELLEIVVDNLGPEIYNLGVRDTKKLISERIADIETDIDMLEKQA